MDFAVGAIGATLRAEPGILGAMIKDKAELTELIRQAGLEDFQEQLVAGSLPAIRLEVAPEGAGAGRSRFGGEPDLPPQLQWPRNPKTDKHLWFLAQIALDELPDVPGREQIPPKGMLWFFYDVAEEPWGFDPGEAGGFRVLFEADAATIEPRATPPDVLAAAKEFLDEDRPYEPTAVRFSGAFTMPSIEEIDGVTPEQMEALEEALQGADQGEEDDEPSFHWLLGHPWEVQGDMRAECQFVSNGIYCGDEKGYEKGEAMGLTAGIDDWMLLMQLDTDNDEQGPGWMWGDCGRLYFWIRKQDLAAQDFSKVWCVLQCF